MNELPDWVLPRADGYRLYFGVPDGKIANLPADAVFDVIDCAKWVKTRWQAVDRIAVHGKDKGEYSRFYRIVKEREMDADEAAVWCEYIDNWERDNLLVGSE